MVEIKNSLIKHQEEVNAAAWLLGLSAVGRTFEERLAERKEKLFQLKSSPQFDNPESTLLIRLSENLVNELERILPKLETIALKHNPLSDLYLRYDKLKFERDQLVNKLRVEKHDFKDQMALEINRLR